LVVLCFFFDEDVLDTLVSVLVEALVVLVTDVSALSANPITKTAMTAQPARINGSGCFLKVRI
jgi:hypothetical protein